MNRLCNISQTGIQSVKIYRDSANILVPFVFCALVCAAASSWMRINTAFSLLSLLIGYCSIDRIVPGRNYFALINGNIRLARGDYYPRGAYSDFYRCIKQFSNLCGCGLLIPFTIDVFTRVFLVSFAICGSAANGQTTMALVRESRYSFFFVSPQVGDIMSAVGISLACLSAVVHCFLFLLNVATENDQIRQGQCQAARNGQMQRKPNEEDVRRLFEILASSAMAKGEVDRLQMFKQCPFYFPQQSEQQCGIERGNFQCQRCPCFPARQNMADCGRPRSDEDGCFRCPYRESQRQQQACTEELSESCFQEQCLQQQQQNPEEQQPEQFEQQNETSTEEEEEEAKKVLKNLQGDQSIQEVLEIWKNIQNNENKEEILQQFLSARRQEKCPENPERDEKKNQ